MEALLLSLLAGAAMVAVLAINRLHDKGLPPPAAGPPPDRGEAVRRVLKHLQRKKIAELEEGVAAVVVGTVRAIPKVPLLTSPVTSTPCLGFHVDVRYLQLDENWRLPQLYEVARCAAFDVTDETGTLYVDPAGLELAITDGPLGRWNTVPEPLRPYINPQYHNVPITIEEGLLHDGATILVCGVVARAQTTATYRDNAHYLVMRATATFPLVASTDKDLLLQGNRPIAPEELRKR